MNATKELGQRGEDEVCKYLARLGHSILERNWRYGRLEIDIITLAVDGIHFVEVKTRMAPMQGEPEDAVNVVKQKRIVSAAGRYLARKDTCLGKDMEIWFDAAAVIFDGEKTDIRYHVGAFVPIYI